MRLKVTLEELSPRPVRISGGDVTERTLTVGESYTVDTTGSSVTFTEVDDRPGNPGGGDVWEHGNPNGIVNAVIAPKLPKSGGETQQVQEGGRLVERAVADLGVATQGGGPESGDGKTPGPQPEDASLIGGGTGNAAATGPEGDTDDRDAEVVKPPAPVTSNTKKK